MAKIKLSDICNPKQWKTIPTSDLLEEGYPVYGANGIIGYYSEFNHENPVVAVTCRGATCGSINITVPKAYVTGNAMCLDDVRSDIEMEYLYYCLKHYDFNKVISGSAQPQITRQGMNKIYITVCTHDEQISIVNKLKKVERVIELRKQELQSLDDLIKARFVEMFGDPITNPKEWKMVELGKLTTIGSSKRIFEKEYVSEGIPFYRTKEIVELSKGNSISTELFITKERFFEIKDKYGVPKKGDLLVSAVGTIGVIWIVDGSNDFYFKDGNLIRVDASEKFDSVYMKNLLENLIDDYKKQMSTGTTYNALTISGLTKLKVYDVPIELQNLFSEFVNQVYKSKVVA